MNDELNRAYLAEKVFTNKKQLAKLNAIVHPAVRKDFTEWLELQHSPYVIQENPLLFENHNEDHFDFVISVVAEEEVRIKRVISRDGHSRADVINRLRNQTSDKRRISKSDFIIQNTKLADTKTKVIEIHQKLLTLNP